ncbi:unnamed protein product (macronuclear) [Paramecium tetraurelia]|uniref:Uncharacterized protein n=1 Tax=Paramecium tetraurelia TaxID=5888 RepID=A0CN58_PARTE|nr:uncharacterized protein GSPATT00008666001 [Paramecium tetraurelia]CAK72225.1 unnamed protein product [Paramecium tetraurelia]|eukprot:XP_001439622.1 hypothetical protein (macronuclear) [Paramecium tetraurelia strain d4-2]
MLESIKLLYLCTAIPLGYVLEANVPYLSAENKESGVVIDKVNDRCMNLNFFTVCEQLNTEQSCKLGSCLWDPIEERCYEWHQAPCQSYPKALCQWNYQCELVNQTQVLYLNQNYTLMNEVDSNQQDGRNVGSWLYEFGLIVGVIKSEKDKEEYNFTKCTLKARCEFIQIINYNNAHFECGISDLNCYYDEQEGKCKKISAKTACELIRQVEKCNSGTAPCIWIDQKCQMFNDAVVSCTALDQNRCLNNENCYLEDTKCMSYLSCSDYKAKIKCDESTFFCYFDEYEQSCKQLTKHIQCKQIGKKRCSQFKNCKFNEDTQICEEILQDFYCQKFAHSNCKDNIDCDWDDNLQICNWKYSTQNCDGKTADSCDTLDCYFDEVMNQCSTIKTNTNCEFLGQNACSNQKIIKDNMCQWSETRSLCLAIFDFSCEDLNKDFCKLNQKCFIVQNKCQTRKQCKDNASKSECEQDATQSCYFDSDQQICRRVTSQTACKDILREDSCKKAICSWQDGYCVSIENVTCLKLETKNCMYSSKCQLQNDKCIPLDICETNNGDSQTCNSDPNHCFYNSNSKICKSIDGTSDCSLLYGADNCFYGPCTLLKLANKKLQCIQFEYAGCTLLTKEYCHFGQCAWNETQCVSYPVVIEDEPQDNPDAKPDETEHPQAVNSTYLHILLNLLVIILE